MTLTCREPKGTCLEDAQEQDDFRIKPEAWHYVGCKLFSSEKILTVDKAYQGVLCAMDEDREDVYSIEYNHCRRVSYAITITVTVETPCDPADYEIKWQSICEGQNQCEDTNPKPHVYQRTMFVGTSNSPIPTSLFTVRLLPKKPGIDLKYTLEASVIEP